MQRNKAPCAGKGCFPLSSTATQGRRMPDVPDHLIDNDRPGIYTSPRWKKPMVTSTSRIKPMPSKVKPNT